MFLINLIKSANFRITIAVIGVMLTGFGLFATLREDKPHISFEIINTTNILDIHATVEKLTILFQGEDIQKENLNLCIITVKVVNDGGTDILQSHYDEDVIWGLELFDGEIIENRLMDSNSDYIKSKLNPKLKSNTNIIEVEQLIFERNKYFILEMLVLHDKQMVPRIVPKGKIAGIEKLEIVDSVETEKSFVERSFSGNAWVQLVRMGAYFLGGLLVVIVAIVIGAALAGPITRKRRDLRKKRFNKLLAGINETERSKHASQFVALADIYAIGGSNELKVAKVFLEDKELVEMVYDSVREEKVNQEHGIIPIDALELEEDSKRRRTWVSMKDKEEIMEILVENNLVKKGRGNKPNIDKTVKEYLDRFTGQ